MSATYSARGTLVAAVALFCLVVPVHAGLDWPGKAAGPSSRRLQSGVKVLVHPGSAAENSDSAPETWVVTVPKGCTDKELGEMTKTMPVGIASYRQGHPDKGGLCMFMVTASLKDLEEIISNNVWPESPIIESDFEWHMVPEIDLQEDVTVSPSGLRGNGGPGAGQNNPPSWGIDRIDDRDYLDQNYETPTDVDGAGAHVYVLDTGVRTTHNDFGGRAIPTFDITSGSMEVCEPTDTECAKDRQGHGTHCSGTIGGSTYGVAKQVTIHAGKVLSDSGSGSWSWFSSAVDWVLSNGARPAIISASLGGRGTVSSVTTAITNAVNGGVVVVVAAGNEGSSGTPDACSYSPAGVPAALTIGSTRKPGSAGDDERSYFSNIGSCVDLFAPGSSIASCGISSDSSSATMSGTSMACPHVAGAAALLMGEVTGRTPEQVSTLLKARATAGVIADVGAGSVNKLLYVGADVPGPTPAPPPTSAPTPYPMPGGTWVVIAGDCTIDYGAHCAMSPNYPAAYPDTDTCEIAVGANLGSISPVDFNTETNFDFLTINGAQYHGSRVDGDNSVPPDGLSPTSTIGWTPDGSVTRAGWKLCQDGASRAPTPVPDIGPTPAPTYYVQPTGSPTPLPSGPPSGGNATWSSYWYYYWYWKDHSGGGETPPPTPAATPTPTPPPVILIPYSGMDATNSPGSTSRAAAPLTQTPINNNGFGSAGTCMQTGKSWGESFWKVELGGRWNVETVTLTNHLGGAVRRLQNIEIYVDDELCLSAVDVPSGGTLQVDCVATGSSIKLLQTNSAKEKLHLCGFSATGSQA